MLASQGQLTAAVTAYGESVEADPGFADGWYNLGNVLLGMGRFNEAEAPLRRALRVAPQHDKARLFRARARARARG